MTAEGRVLDDLDRKRRRPFLVTVLAIVVLSITIIQLVRLIDALASWDFLANLNGAPPLYFALTGLIWFVLGAILFWGLWSGNPRAPLAARILTVLFLAYHWVEKIISIRQGNQFENWLFTLGITLLVFIFIFWTLSRLDAKTYFGEMHEQSSQN
jgi:hypothetical protein